MHLTGFGGAEDSTIANDPDGGMNQVVRTNRSDSAETFAGTTVSLGPNQAVPVIPLDATTTQMNVRVRAPAAGIPIRLKIENAADSNVSVETEAITTAGDTWETLTFDFSMQAIGYGRHLTRRRPITKSRYSPISAPTEQRRVHKPFISTTSRSAPAVAAVGGGGGGRPWSDPRTGHFCDRSR